MSDSLSYRPFRLEISGSLRLLDPLHIGTGERLSLATDAPVLLDAATGQPYVPATSLRGALRDHLEREAGLLGCATSVLDSLFGYAPQGEDAVSYSGRLTVFDAYASGANSQVLEVRDHVRHNREWAAADSGAKFDSEAVLPAAEQSFALRLLYEGDSNEDPELILLREGVRLLTSGELRLGGKSGWGFGRVQVASPEYSVFDRRNPQGLASFFAARLGQDTPLQTVFDWPPALSPAASHRRDPLSSLTFHLRLDFEGPVLIKAPIPRLSETVGKPEDPRTYAETGLWEADHVFLQRANDDAYYLPGSSLRGVLRSQAERIDATLSTSFSKILFGWTKSSEEVGVKGMLEVGEGTLEGAPYPIFLDHVAIDRITAAAVDSKKFSLSALASPKFSVPIRVEFGKLEQDVIGALRLLAFLLRDLMGGRLWAGSGVSRGYGYIKSALLTGVDGNLLETLGWEPGIPVETRLGRRVFKQPGSLQFQDLAWLWKLWDRRKAAL